MPFGSRELTSGWSAERAVLNGMIYVIEPLHDALELAVCINPNAHHAAIKHDESRT